MFSGSWGDDNKLFGDDGSLTALYKVGHVPGGDSQTFGNKIMTTLGLASVVYSLGMKDAKILTAKKVAKIVGTRVIIFTKVHSKKRGGLSRSAALCASSCYQTETFFTFFSKFKGLLKIVLLKNPTECVILCPRFRRRYVKIPSPGRSK